VSEADFIRGAVGNEGISVEEANRLRRIIRSSGSEDYSRELAKSYSKRALGALDPDLLDRDVIEFLEGFTYYLMNRA
jgi:geranylgeranyl pyrophosphate synthase